MKKSVLVALLVSVVFAFSGCTYVQSAQNFKNMKMGEGRKEPLVQVSVTINGWYLFGFIPLMVGSRAGDSKTSFFQDNATVEHAVALACKEARGEGAGTILNLTSTYDQTFMVLLGFHQAQASVSAIK